MKKISVFGSTGYAGANIAAAAASRGFAVTAFARHLPAAPLPGVRYEVGSLEDQATRTKALTGADVVVAAVAPRGEMEKSLRQGLAQLASEAAAAKVRLGVVGGAGSLLVGDSGPALVDTAAVPEEARAEARIMTDVLSDLRATDGGLDWFLVSPAIVFGDFAPGDALGRYRIGGDVLLPGLDGPSEISGSDFGLAFVDEIEHPAHRRERFSVAH